MKENDDDLDLEDCREEVKRLEEENHHLRASSNAFGELAERLRDSLSVERRAGRDRRRQPRTDPDRRSLTSTE